MGASYHTSVMVFYLPEAFYSKYSSIQLSALRLSAQFTQMHSNDVKQNFFNIKSCLSAQACLSKCTKIWKKNKQIPFIFSTILSVCLASRVGLVPAWHQLHLSLDEGKSVFKFFTFFTSKDES